MDGDVAPLPEFAELAGRYGCRLMVDEAHGTGALGPGGRGTVAAAGLGGEVDVIVGTLGKALGGYGAYVCASAELRDLLINTARPFIFSTAPPPPVGRRPRWRRSTLLESRPGLVEQPAPQRARCSARRSRAEGLDVGAVAHADRPGVVGDARRAMALCERALERRRLRPGDPAAHRPGGNLAAAPDGDGEPPRRRAAARGAGDRQGGAGARRRRLRP